MGINVYDIFSDVSWLNMNKMNRKQLIYWLQAIKMAEQNWDTLIEIPLLFHRLCIH